MPTFAAVDIGSNSVRLKIAKLARNRLKTTYEDRAVTRLGESVFTTGLLDPSSIAATVAALRRFHRAVQQHNVDLVRVVATSAVRDARNATAFLNWVRSVTGWRTEVISGLEEGRMIHLGVTSQLRLGAKRVLLVDLGGGSCELTLSEGGQIRFLVSMPLGAVRLTQELIRRDPPRNKEMGRLQSLIGEELGRVRRQIIAFNPQICIATSGTAAALADAWRSRPGIRSRKRAAIPAAGVATLVGELSRKTLVQRKAMPGIGPRRAEIIVAGASVFAGLLEQMDLTSFRYSPLGLRDGILAQMAAEYEPTEKTKHRLAAERANSLAEMGRRYAIDHRFATHVRSLVLDLFQKLKTVHQLPPPYAEWLAAAAMLGEAGSYINRTGRHRHAWYIIAHSEIFGYTIRQRQLIAAIARFIGKSRPSGGNLPRMLAASDQVLLPRAVALLRLARALDQGRHGAVRSVNASIRNGRVVLRLSAGTAGAELELWALEKEAAYFREVFGFELVAKVV